jgi:hypothetical protein
MLRNWLVPRSGHAAPRRAGSARLGVGLAAGLSGLAFLVIRELLVLLAGAGGGMVDAAAAVAVLVNLTLVGLLVFDLHEGVSALLSDSDLDLLRRAPLAPRALFGLKLLDALPRTSLLGLVLVAPAVLAFEDAYPMHAWAWLLVPAQLLALWAMPLGLGLAAALLLLRIVPARQAREALGLVSTLALFVLWLANSFLLPRVGLRVDTLPEVRAALRSLAGDTVATPGGWLAAALVAGARGDVRGSLTASARIIGLGALALGLAAGVASRTLEVVQGRVIPGSTQRRRTRPIRRGTPDAARSRPLTAAFLTRDGKLLARNWTLLGDLLATAVLWTLLPAVLSPLLEFPRATLARAMLLSLTVAIGSEIAARALPLERRALAWARLSPAGPARWLAGRLAGAALLSAALLALATLGTTRALGLDAAEILGALAVVAPALALALALGLWAGATFGDPGWANPRAMLTPPGRAVTTLLLIVQAVAWLSLTAFDTQSGIAVIGGAWIAAIALAGLAFIDTVRRLARFDVASR